MSDTYITLADDSGTLQCQYDGDSIAVTVERDESQDTSDRLAWTVTITANGIDTIEADGPPIMTPEHTRARGVFSALGSFLGAYAETERHPYSENADLFSFEHDLAQHLSDTIYLSLIDDTEES